MKNSQKMGGIAALYAGAAYVLGFVLWGGVLGYSSDLEPAQKVASFVNNQSLWYILNLVVYVVAGFFLVVLALALYERLKTGSPAIMQTATAIGLIWAGVVIASGMICNIGIENVVDLYGTDPDQAASVWLAIDSVFEGLGGSNEVLGGIWVLLISWAALRAGGLPKILNYLGVVVGVAGIVSILVPALAELFIFIYALGQIVWFIWLGIVMLRGRTSAEA